jgi:hypothetical protein
MDEVTRLYAASRALRFQDMNLKVDGVNFALERYPFLIDLFDDDHRQIVVRKGSQMGFTVCFVLRTIDKCLTQYPRGILYLMPTRDDVSDFSKSRFDRLLKENHVLSQCVAGTDSINIKRVGNCFVYFRGSKSRSQLKSIPVDGVVFDEEDEMDPVMIELAKHRIDAAEGDAGDEASLSTPTVPDYGVDLKYRRSDQRMWMIKCQHCGAWTCMEESFPDCLVRVDDDTVIRGCKKCKKEIFVIDGEWVAAAPENDERHGYFVSQLCSPTVPPKTILDEYEDPDPPPSFDIKEFYNHRLGLAYASLDDKLDDAAMNAVMGDHARAHAAQGPCIAGCDVGKRDIPYMIGEKVTEKHIKVLDYGIVTDFGMLHDKWQRFNVVTAVIDEMAETRKVREFIDSHSGTWGCWYSESQRQAYDWKTKEERVTVNRTELLDHSHRMVIQKNVTFPRKDERWDPMVAQMKNIGRVQTRDDKTGLPKTQWVILGGRKNDHLRHAFAYMCLAAEDAPLSEQIRRIITPSQARSSSRTWMAS